MPDQPALTLVQTTSPKAVLSTLIEKTLLTYIQAFLTVMALADTFDVDTATAAGIAAIPAGLTALLAMLPQVPTGLPFATDLLLRTGRTYLVSFIGFLIAVPVFRLDYSILAGAATAALPGTIAFLKGLVARRIGESGTAGLLPAQLDTASVKSIEVQELPLAA